MTDKTLAMNSEAAKKKREQTNAKKAALEKSKNDLMQIAKAVPQEWASDDEQKLSLVKSIYTDVLGTYVEKTTVDGKEVEAVRSRPLGDLRYFMFKAAQRKLNPFLGQIHAVYIWDSTAQQEKLVTITGIDGFASLAQRTGQYAGLGETEFEMYPDDHPKYPGLPKSAKVDIYKYNPVTGAREAVLRATAWWDEYAKYKEKWEYDPALRKKVPTGEMELNSVWKNRPKGQLEKCAQALAFRRAFPEETSGMYTVQEIDRLRDKPEVIDVTPEAPKVSTRDQIKKALEERKAAGISVKGPAVVDIDGRKTNLAKGDVLAEPKPTTKAFGDEELTTTPEEQKVLDEQAKKLGGDHEASA